MQSSDTIIVDIKIFRKQNGRKKRNWINQGMDSERIDDSKPTRCPT